MPAKNDITGDSIISRTNTKQFEENMDKIFGDSYERRRAEKRKADAEYWAKLEAETKARLEANSTES